MRERTAFDADVLEACPHCALLVTTGAANASIDVAAARAQGVVRLRDRVAGPARRPS